MGFFFLGKTNEMNGKEKKRGKEKTCGNGEEEGAYYKAADFLKTMSHAGSVSKQDAPF